MSKTNEHASENEQYEQLSIFNSIEEPDDIVKKSNSFISRIGKTTFLGERLLLLSLGCIEERSSASYAGTALGLYYDDIYKKMKTDFSNGLVAELSVASIRKYMKSKTGGAFYRSLEELLNYERFATSWLILYKDPINGLIGTTMLITGALYDRNTGKILIKFNSDMKGMLLCAGGAGHYTELSKKLMLNFSNIHSFSCYQLLKSKLAYAGAIQAKRKLPPQKEYLFECSLPELKFLLRSLDADFSDASSGNLSVRKAIEAEDYERAEEVLGEKYKTKRSERWDLFKKDVIEKASKEINGFPCPFNNDEEILQDYWQSCADNHPTDIHFRVELVRGGRGGKVSSLKFYISWDAVCGKHVKPAEVPDGEEIKKECSEDDFLDEMRSFITIKTDPPLKTRDFRAIAEEANWDMNKIRIANSVLEQRGGADNPVGFFRKAIREGWCVTQGAKKSGTKSAQAYNTYMHHEYTDDDWKVMEQQLVLGPKDNS